MNGHVKSMHFQLCMEAAATLLSLLLIMAVDSTRGVAASSNQECGNPLLQTLRLTKLIRMESVELLRKYKASQGELSELFCKGSLSEVPDPNISGLESSQRIASISMQLQAFLPHFKWVYEQQTDLLSPTSLLLDQLSTVRARSRDLVALVNNFYRDLFPNLPAPEPAGGPTTLPPRKNYFQQKLYGCIVLKTYKDFLFNAIEELRSLKTRCAGGR
uniref:Ciliary neurotrophic factor n=1 Tax=Mola mola TaxID=94237 RepID=A0A3Q4B3W8_MOLML